MTRRISTPNVNLPHFDVYENLQQDLADMLDPEFESTTHVIITNLLPTETVNSVSGWLSVATSSKAWYEQMLENPKVKPRILAFDYEINLLNFTEVSFFFLQNGLSKITHSLSYEELCRLCVIAIKSGNKPFVAWCMVKLLEGVLNNAPELANPTQVLTYDHMQNVESRVMTSLTVWYIQQMGKLLPTGKQTLIEYMYDCLRLPEYETSNFTFKTLLNSHYAHLDVNTILMGMFNQFYHFTDTVNQRMRAEHMSFANAYHKESIELQKVTALSRSVSNDDIQEVEEDVNEDRRSLATPLPDPTSFMRVDNTTQQQDPAQLIRDLEGYIGVSATSNSSGRWERFWHGMWNRHHVVPVKRVFESWVAQQHRRESITTKEVLNWLNNELTIDNKEMNTTGSLAKIIKKYQIPRVDMVGIINKNIVFKKRQKLK